jgi:hypothetical protein
VGLAEADLGGVVNTSDADMIAAFATDDVQAVVTWNPLVSTILEDPAANKLFDSSDIPGEIIDLLVVNTETLEANPDFGKALVGAWYEVMALMQAGDEEVLTALAEASGTDLAGYKAQLDSDEDVLDPGRGRGLRLRPRAQGHDGQRGRVPVRQGHPRRRRAVGRFRGRGLSRRRPPRATRTTSCSASTRPSCRWRRTGRSELSARIARRRGQILPGEVAIVRLVRNGAGRRGRAKRLETAWSGVIPCA